MRAAQLATSEELRVLADGLKQKLALYAEEARSYEITAERRSWRFRVRRSTRNTRSSSQRCKGARRSASNRSRTKQRIDDMIIEATRRRDDEMASLTRSGPAGAGARVSVLRQFDRAGVQFAIARPAVGHGDLACRLQERARRPSDQIHRMERNDRRAHVDGGSDEDGGDDNGRRGAHGGGRGRRRGLAWRARRGDDPIDPIVGRRRPSPACSAFCRRSWARSPPDPPRRPRRLSPAWRARSPRPTSACGRFPQDMLSLVHHNELIMPAAEAGAFRSLLSDGGAPGARAAAGGAYPSDDEFPRVRARRGSVSQWMRSNSSAMMRAMDEAVRHGARLGLRPACRAVEACRWSSIVRRASPAGDAASSLTTPSPYLGAAPRGRAATSASTRSSRRAAPRTDYSYAIDQLQAAASGMHDGLAGRRLVFQLGGRGDLQHLSVDQLSVGEHSSSCRRASGADELDGVEPDAGRLPGDHPAARVAGDGEFRLRRHAERSFASCAASRTSRPADSRSSSTRSCLATGRASLARAHHLLDRHFAAPRPRPSTPSSARRRVAEFTPDPINLTVAYSGYLFDWTYRRMILHYANLARSPAA